MIENCKSCGTNFNNETVGHCPACNMKKGIGNIGQFMREQIREKKAVVNSFRRSEVTRYESQTGKKVFS